MSKVRRFLALAITVLFLTLGQVNAVSAQEVAEPDTLTAAQQDSVRQQLRRSFGDISGSNVTKPFFKQIPKLYFITTGSTASASEALINGLKPYKKVYTIGKKTYGKPVGMHRFNDNKDYYAFVPVCFRIANADEVADYYDGIEVNVKETDDITKKFGDPEEASLKQALHHIETGSFIQNKTIPASSSPVLGPSYRKEMIKLNKKFQE